MKATELRIGDLVEIDSMFGFGEYQITGIEEMSKSVCGIWAKVHRNGKELPGKVALSGSNFKFTGTVELGAL